jgi:hypothetical protein
MATTTNYSNRKTDLLIFQNADYTGRDAQITTDFSNPSKVISGIQKAAQRWIIMFLTKKGSVLGDSSFGTDFMTKLLARKLPDELAIQNEFALAARDINDYFRAKVTSTIPNDEYITQASLLEGWSLTRTSLKLRIGLTTRAGTSYKIVLPVSIVIK